MNQKLKIENPIRLVQAIALPVGGATKMLKNNTTTSGLAQLTEDQAEVKPRPVQQILNRSEDDQKV